MTLSTTAFKEILRSAIEYGRMCSRAERCLTLALESCDPMYWVSMAEVWADYAMEKRADIASWKGSDA